MGRPRCRSSFAGQAGATFRGLALLEEMSIPVRVTTVLSSVNVGRLYDLAVCLARFTNIRGVGLDPLVLAGAARTTPDLSPSPEAVRSGVRALFEAMEWINRDCAIPIEWRESDAVRRALFGQRAGPSVLPRLPGRESGRPPLRRRLPLRTDHRRSRHGGRRHRCGRLGTAADVLSRSSTSWGLHDVPACRALSGGLSFTAPL